MSRYLYQRIIENAYNLCDKDNLPMNKLGVYSQIPIQKITIGHRLLRNPHISLEDILISIKQKGLINPPLVRLKDDHYEIIAGHRRLEACKLLGWQNITCHIVDVDDKNAYEISLIENVQQKTMSAIEEARAFKQYVDTFGWGSESDLAHRIGKSQEYISKRIRLLSLPESLQKDVLEGRISVSAAEELLPLNDKVIVQELGHYIAQNGLNKEETRQIVKVTRKNLDVQGGVFKDSIATTIRLKDLEENNTLDDRLSEVYETLRATLKKCILGIRISLKNIDDVAEELESIKYENSRYGWIINEIIMQNRFRLHEQLDLLLKQSSKLSRLYENERMELSAS
ncbi:MAG: ParB/RepB/Spo0J family partition protein [Thermoproteota archaeon]|nr:ParB/RepB/Spo0J family partition protein [Thermoproteota archaeon]